MGSLPRTPHNHTNFPACSPRRSCRTSHRPAAGSFGSFSVVEEFITHSAEETTVWGREFSKRLQPPVLVLLTGDLGTGKTTLTKGIVSGLGAAHEDDVTSPTFTLVHVYGKAAKVYHADLSRTETFHNSETLGMKEMSPPPPSSS